MYGVGTLLEATKLRAEGVGVREVARRLGVSVGWASVNVGHIGVRVKVRMPLLRATTAQITQDKVEWAAARFWSAQRLSQLKKSQRLEKLAAFKDATDSFAEMPAKGTAEYAWLDALQQKFGKDPGAGFFGMLSEEAPALLSHLVAWRETRHGVMPEGKDVRFISMAERVRTHVKSTLQAPSNSSKDKGELAAARWLSRWKSACVSSIDEKVDPQRKALFLEVSRIVEGLRSSFAEFRSTAVKSIESGRWDELIDQLVATSGAAGHRMGSDESMAAKDM